MIVAGVDPGTQPTIAILNGATCALSVFDELSAAQKVNGRNTHVIIPELIRFALEESGAELVVLEKVWMRPTGGPAAQGAVSQARLVSSMHMIWGIAIGLDLPVELVIPQTWKRHYGLHGPDKELSRLKCMKIMPEAGRFLTRKKDHNRAEAILLARYGLTLTLKEAA